MMHKRDHIKKPDPSRYIDIDVTKEMKNIRVPPGQSCNTLPKVKCPVRNAEYCVYRIIQVTPVETDYACPACGEIVKKDVFTTDGWKTLILDKTHETI